MKDSNYTTYRSEQLAQRCYTNLCKSNEVQFIIAQIARPILRLVGPSLRLNNCVPLLIISCRISLKFC